MCSLTQFPPNMNRYAFHILISVPFTRDSSINTSPSYTELIIPCRSSSDYTFFTKPIITMNPQQSENDRLQHQLVDRVTTLPATATHPLHVRSLNLDSDSDATAVATTTPPSDLLRSGVVVVHGDVLVWLGDGVPSGTLERSPRMCRRQMREEHIRSFMGFLNKGDGIRNAGWFATS